MYAKYFIVVKGAVVLILIDNICIKSKNRHLWSWSIETI